MGEAMNFIDETPSDNFFTPQFDILQWHPSYKSCQVYFLNHGQHDQAVQAVAALINIQLPFQWSQHAIVKAKTEPYYSSSHSSTLPTLGSSFRQNVSCNWVSLIPYLRRLVITGFDKEAILHGFFGDDWLKGIGPLQECERRNYLFYAKSGGWAKAKSQYDMNSQETVPFLKPLDNVQVAEIEAAERNWSQWLAMEDWMLGSRAPSNQPEAQ